MKNLDKELQKTEALKNRSWGKAVSKLKKHFDVWVTDQLSQHFFNDFKLAYMPLIMNIDAGGVTNTDLAKCAGITKQGMSHIVLEMEVKKYIKIENNPDDKRSSIIYLTDKGKEFVLTARNCMKNFHTDIEKLLGKKKFNTLLDSMMKIAAYNEELNKKKSSGK